MPSWPERPPWPCVLSENESTSDTARFHCEWPAQICEVCWLPGAEATLFPGGALKNILFAKALCVAWRHCIPMKTEQLVAPILSGLRMMRSGNSKSMAAKVELAMG